MTAILSRQITESSDLATVEVIDQGPGISPEVLPHIFERYVMGDRATGLGLGLFIAKQIALLHGGDLTVSSSPTGSCFVLTLPRLGAVPKTGPLPEEP